MPSIIALAGRRPDPPDAQVSRFPLANVPLVEERLRRLFHEEGAELLVSSAACGADLVGLEVAGRLGIRRRVVLPFGREKFRQTSVTDRPGEWGPLYDRILDQVGEAGDLFVLEGREGGDQAYLAANEWILDEAVSVSRDRAADGAAAHALAVIVWEGESRGPDASRRASRKLPPRVAFLRSRYPHCASRMTKTRLRRSSDLRSGRNRCDSRSRSVFESVSSLAPGRAAGHSVSTTLRVLSATIVGSSLHSA